MKKIGVGLYGTNGHQIQNHLDGHATAELVAIAGFAPDKMPDWLDDPSEIACYQSLEELLNDERVELVSLCSPRRIDQADDAIKALKAGKHVYAEKPCAMSEETLDAIFATVKETGKQFHEMAGTAFGQPYLEMRRLVGQGVIGDIVQVLAQKSYPYYDGRPQDEDVDGGLIGQNSIHAVRFIEHVAGLKIIDVDAVETTVGNPVDGGGLRMAASLMMTLENGGVASVIANYLNSPQFGSWGNEALRIFGTKGMLEAVDGGARTRLVLNDKDCGPIDASAPGLDYFDLFVDSLNGNATMPLTLEEELHPTRVVIRAKAKAS